MAIDAEEAAAAVVVAVTIGKIRSLLRHMLKEFTNRHEYYDDERLTFKI